MLLEKSAHLNTAKLNWKKNNNIKQKIVFLVILFLAFGPVNAIRQVSEYKYLSPPQGPLFGSPNPSL